jgi:fluoroquinolone transport system permease protein
MRRLAACIRADLYLQVRYGFYAVYAIVTAAYILLLKQAPLGSLKILVPMIVFSDPSMLGFFFIGGLVLLEKGENTLEYITATPLRIGEYLISKMISLSILALLASFAVTLFSYPSNVHKAQLGIGIVLTSFFFILVGFIAVARFRTVNEYILSSIIYVTFLFLPLLDYFGLWRSWIFYIFPTQAALVLIGGAFQPMELWRMAYGIGSLLLWIALAFPLAYRSFYRFIILKEGERSS